MQAPRGGREAEVRVCLILENSTVCHIVDELVCYAPSTLVQASAWLVLMVSLTMILVRQFLSASFSCQGHLFFHDLPEGWLWVLFSTESLILAQDERWRRA